jgi:hypothetical protein
MIIPIKRKRGAIGCPSRSKEYKLRLSFSYQLPPDDEDDPPQLPPNEEDPLSQLPPVDEEEE